MKIGANLQKLSALIESMKNSDPEGFKRVTELHYETFPSSANPEGYDVRISYVEIDGDPQKHPVDLSKGPWLISEI